MSDIFKLLGKAVPGISKMSTEEIEAVTEILLAKNAEVTRLTNENAALRKLAEQSCDDNDCIYKADLAASQKENARLTKWINLWHNALSGTISTIEDQMTRDLKADKPLTAVLGMSEGRS